MPTASTTCASSSATPPATAPPSSWPPTVRIDNTPPTTSQNDPGAYLRGTKTLTGSAADSGSGVDHVDFQRAPTGGGTWTTIDTDSTPGDGFQASFDTTGVSDGHYDFRTVAYDVAGNQAAATPVTDRLVDNTPPTAIADESRPVPARRRQPHLVDRAIPAARTPPASSRSPTSTRRTAARPGSRPAPASTRPRVADGNVELRVVATDAAGNTTASAPVTSLVDNTKPATTDNAPSGWQSSPVTVTLTGNDGGSGVNVTEYSVDGSPGYTVGTSVSIPAPVRRLERRRSHDRVLLGRQRRQHRDDQEHHGADRRHAAGLPDRARPPTISAAPSTSTRRSGHERLRHPVGQLRVRRRRRLDVDADRNRHDRPGPVHHELGHDDSFPTVTTTSGSRSPTTRTTSRPRPSPDKVVDNTAPNVALVGAPTEGQIVAGSIGNRRVRRRMTRRRSPRSSSIVDGSLARDRLERAVLAELGHDDASPTARRRSRSSSTDMAGQHDDVRRAQRHRRQPLPDADARRSGLRTSAARSR